MAYTCCVFTLLPLLLFNIQGYSFHELENSNIYKHHLAKPPEYLGIDQALLEISITPNNTKSQFVVTGITDECYKCRQPIIAILDKHLPTAYLKINFTYSTFSLNITQNDASGINCSYPNYSFGEKGKYLLTIHQSTGNYGYTCAESITMTKMPEFSELALLIAGCALVGVLFLWFCYNSLCRVPYWSSGSISLSGPSSSPVQRNISHDVFNTPDMRILVPQTIIHINQVEQAQIRLVKLCSVTLGARGSSSPKLKRERRERNRRLEEPLAHMAISFTLAKLNENSTIIESVQNLDSDVDWIKAHDTSSSARRLKSLDTFRGISLTIMIFVNYGGGKYWFFKHSRWNGLTVADLVFPWFVFMMGVSITLSFRVLQCRGASKLSTFKKIVRRSIILFVLGLILNNGYSLENFRIPGVLQRFSISYFVVATMQFLTVKTDRYTVQTHWLSEFVDIIQLSVQWLLMLVLVIVYLVVTFVVKFPGCPGGFLGPGGLSADQDQVNCTGGIAGYIDRQIFTENHIYQHPTCKEVYQTETPYDPEGILGSVTSILLAFLGVQAGKILFCYSTNKERYLRWILWASILGILSVGLTGGTQNEGAIPINKNLWSLSFVLANASMAFFLLLVCYFVIDDQGWWDGGPFCFPGMNSILVYCGSEIMDDYFPFSWKMHHGGSHYEELAMNIWGTTLWICISYYLFTKKFFLKI